MVIEIPRGVALVDGWRHQPLVDCGGRDKLLDLGFPEGQDWSADIAEAGLAQLQLLEGGALTPSITRLPVPASWHVGMLGTWQGFLTSTWLPAPQADGVLCLKLRGTSSWPVKDEDGIRE